MNRCHRAAVALSLTAIVLASIVLGGWTLHVPAMTSAFLGGAPTSPQTAAGLLLSGTALLLLLRSPAGSRPSSDIVVWLGGLASLLGAAMLVTRAIETRPAPSSVVRYLSAAAAGPSWLSRAGLVMIGAAIVLVRRSRFVAAAQWLPFVLGMAAFSVIAGLLFNVDAIASLRLVVGTGTATAVAYLALAAGLVLGQPARGLGALIVSDSSGGRLARGLLVPVVLIPVALHWLELQGERRGIYAMGVGWVLDATTSVVVLGAIVWWTALKLRGADRARADALEKLAESEERYRRLIESSPDAVIVTEGGRIDLVNKAAVQLVGAGNAENVVGRSLLEFVSPEDRGRLDRFCRTLAGAGPASPIEERLLRMDGTPMDVEVIASTLDVRGRRLAQIIVRDITERKRESRALQESEQRLRLITDTISEVFWIADIELDKPVYVSPAYERIWGAPREELDQSLQAFLDTIFPADRERVVDNLKARHDVRPFEHEYRIIRPDGEVRWIWGRGFPVANAAGPVRYYVGAAQDITARKRTEEAVRRSLERFELAARATGDALWEVDVTTGAAWWSDTYYERYGYDRDVPPSVDTWAEHIHPEDRPRVLEGFRHAIDRGQATWRDRYRYKRADGSYADVLDRAYVMTDADGHRKLVGAMLDATTRRGE